MLERRRILFGLLISVSLCSAVSLGAKENSSDATPKEGVPIPMQAYKIPPVHANPGEEYAVGLLDRALVRDAEVTVQFKTLAAEGEQAAGIVFRYQDPKNYYMMIASASDETIALYRMKKGRLKKMDSQDTIVTPITWHTLHITFVQENYTAFLDGELAFGERDPSFKDAGRTGVCIKSGSQIAFRDLRVSK